MEKCTHDRLLIAVLKYAEMNEEWEERRSIRTQRATRAWLREVQKVARERWREIVRK